MRWGETEHLLATVVDVIQIGNWQRAAAHFKGKPQAPKPLTRPGESVTGELPKRTKRPYTQAEMQAVLDNWNDEPGPEEVSDGR